VESNLTGKKKKRKNCENESRSDGGTSPGIQGSFQLI